MTTTAYDTNFISSDIAFTDSNDVVNLQIPFRKVQKIGEIVVGMAGCLQCMVEFCTSLLEYATGQSDDLSVPASIVERTDRDFIAMLYTAATCIKITKPKGSNEVFVNNITSVPTVIGSGKDYVTEGFNEHKNAVVAVLEAVRHDKYTDGDVKYCSVNLDIHNLEVHPMSKDLNVMIAGMQSDVDATNEFLAVPENSGKSFHASTKEHYVGAPSAIPMDAGMLILKQGLDKVRNAYNKK